MSAVVPAVQDWTWEGMIPRATLTLLAGKGGSAKSTLAMHLSALLTKGELPGAYHGKPVNVAYMTAENDVSKVMAPRFLAAGADMDRVLCFDTHMSFPQDQELVLRRLERHEVRVLFVDPLMAYFGELGSYEKSVKTLTAMLEGCARRDITLVGITHITKSAKKPTAAALFGSAGLSTTVRQALVVGETKEAKVVGVVKSNVGADKQGWVFHVSYNPLDEHPDIDAPTVRLVRPAYSDELEKMWETRDGDTADERLLYLLDLLSEGSLDSNTAKDKLCEAFSIKERSAQNVLGAAVSRHLIFRACEGVGLSRRWVVRLAPAGELMKEGA